MKTEALAPAGAKFSSTSFRSRDSSQTGNIDFWRTRKAFLGALAFFVSLVDCIQGTVYTAEPPIHPERWCQCTSFPAEGPRFAGLSSFLREHGAGYRWQRASLVAIRVLLALHDFRE